MLLELRRVYIPEGDRLGDTLLVWSEEVQSPFIDVVYPTEALSDIDGPRERADTHLKLCLDLIKELKGITPLTVHLIDEDHNRRLAHTTDLHETACLSLYPLSSVDHYDDAIDSRQGTEGILCEVLVSRGI